MKSKTTLHVLLVLSMIWAGLSCLSNLMMGLLLPFFQDYYTSHPGLMPEEFYATMERMFEVPKSYYLVCSLLFALELAGAAVEGKRNRPDGLTGRAVRRGVCAAAAARQSGARAPKPAFAALRSDSVRSVKTRSEIHGIKGENSEEIVCHCHGGSHGAVHRRRDSLFGP